MADGDVIKQIKIIATGENIDSTTASLKSLSDATDKARAANDNSAKQAASAGSTWVDYAAKLYLVKSAYEAVSAGSDSASSSIGKATAAIASAMGAVLSYAPHKIGEIWQEGIDKLGTYVALSQQAGTVSTDYYQRLTKGATDAKKPAEEYLKVIQNINKALDRQLGSEGNQNGSTFNVQALELQKNGNLKGQTADVNRLNNAISPQEQIQAALQLIQGATEAGEKLTAIKLAGTLMGPEAAANLKNDNDYIYQIQKSIESVQDKDIIKQADIDRAVAMKTQLDEATKYIDTWFTKSKSDWSSLGIEIQQLWVNAATNLEGVLKWLDSIFAKTTEIAGIKSPQGSIWTSFSDYFTQGMTPEQIQSKFGATPLDDAGRQLEIAKQKLGSQLGNSQNVINARQQTQRADDFLTPDQSKPSPATAAAKDQKDAVDRAIDSLNKHILAQEADTKAIGLGDGALAAFKVTAIETAAKQANGGKETADQAAHFADLKVKAEDAADALAKAKVASEISRGRQLAFASPEDVQIANQLKQRFGDDIPAALASSEAAALRFNKALSDMNTLARQSAATFATDLVSGLEKGQSLMSSLGNAAKNLSSSLTSKAFTDLFSGNFVQAGVEGIGAIVSGIFGGNQAKKDQQAAQAKAAAEAAAQAVADGLARSQQFNNQAQTASIDQSTVSGQLAAFDIAAMQQRADEAAKGNQAIVALENDLAVQRKEIVDKANEAIEKSLNDFLNSIKTGADSILSPEDQLKYAQSKFNSDVSSGRSGNEDALNRVTADAQNLLDIAKGFYASSTGYAAVYQSVTDAITGLASSNNPLGMQNGGFVGMAAGGIVGNGIYNQDSVVARYAGGGAIALAGGEAVTRASSVNANTIGMLNHINRTGQTPKQDNSDVVRVLTQGFNGQTQVLAERLDTLAARIDGLSDTTRMTNNKRRVPGTMAA